VPCSASRVVPGAHRVVGPGTHRGSGPREVHTTADDTFECLPCAYTGSNHDVRPAGASSPSPSTLCGHLFPCSATPRTATTTQALLERTGRDATIPAAVPRTGLRQRPPRACPRTTTGQTTTTPLPSKPLLFEHRTRHDAKTHQDGRQLHDSARHTTTRRRIVRHACKSLPPWPIKGRAIPQSQGASRDDGLRTHARFPPSPRYWNLPQSIPLGLGGQASSPPRL
jgi:hypothetical protein